MSATPWMELAHSYKGMRELLPTGELNPQVYEFFKHTRYPLRLVTKKTPWCGAAVCACLERSGVASPRSARAADFAKWGVECELKPGAIVVFGKADPDAGGSGHVAFLVAVDGDDVLVLGGNQSNGFNVARRPKSRIVAVRWPVT